MTTFKITISELNEHTLAILQLLRTDKSISVEEVDAIPQWQQDEVLKRKKYLDKHPESSVNFDEMMGGLKEKYDL